jgi:hypothetical protein
MLFLSLLPDATEYGIELLPDASSSAAAAVLAPQFSANHFCEERVSQPTSVGAKVKHRGPRVSVDDDRHWRDRRQRASTKQGQIKQFGVGAHGESFHY